MPLEEEATLICTIQNNLQQMADSGMRFKTYRYYQVLSSFINATSSLLHEFQYMTLDNEVFYQNQQNRDDIDYYTDLILQEEEQRETANEQDDEQDDE